MSITCWAACIGGCSTRQSREHYISKGLFGDGGIRIKGFHWCKEEAVNIGVGSATAKILCTAHNERLSNLDGEAKRAFDCFREIFALQQRQKRLAPRRWLVRAWKINGAILERWFLKTFVNLTYVQNANVTWPGGGGPRSIPKDLVEACFGKVAVPRPRGLHAAAGLGENIDSSDYVNFAPLTFGPNAVLVGGLFEFRGFRFVLSWTEQDLEPVVNNVAAKEPAFARWEDSQLLYPLRGIRLKVGPYLAQTVTVVWPAFVSEE